MEQEVYDVKQSFLASLATQQTSQQSEPTKYDESRDELLVRRDGQWIPAVDAGTTPKTKKRDIEKGEDQKDRW